MLGKSRWMAAVAVAALLGVSVPATAKIGAVIGRLAMLERATAVLGGGPLDEERALTSGLLEPCADGRYHLDWPASRGATALSLARLIGRMPGHAPVPGWFADVGPSSPYAEALAQVGGAFTPFGERFAPDKLVSEGELDAVLRAFLATQPATIASAPACGMPPRELGGRSYSGEFRFASAPSPVDAVLSGRSAEPVEPRDELAAVSASEASRLARAGRFVPLEQLAPDPAFSLEETEENAGEMARRLDTLELTVGDLTSVEELEAAEERDLADALQRIGETLAAADEKLAWSARTLAAVRLVDGDRQLRADRLKRQLARDRGRVARLRSSIGERLAELRAEPETTENER